MRSCKKKVADVIISQVVLAGEICFKRGKRDTGRDAEEKHTEKTRQDMIVIYFQLIGDEQSLSK